jgi:uncharacterized membrane protein YfcA
MGLEQIVLVLVGALAGGLVNGLTGFGTAITALGFWLYVMPPTAASSLAIICAAVSQLQTLPMIWHTIRWDRVWPLIVPGLLGVPLGTFLLPHIEPRFFKFGVGVFLVAYSAYVLARRGQISCAWGGRAADGVAGFGGGVLGGLTGLSGVLPVVWTDIRGWTREQRRGVVQTFNISILSLALASHAVAGLLTRQVALAAAVALPAAIAGAWIGAAIYWRLADRGYQRVVMMLLLVSGLTLIWSGWRAVG